jgi:hypothetical protein
MSGFAPQPAHLFEIGDGTSDAGHGIDPAGAQFCGEPPGARAGRRDVETDRILRIDESELGIEQADQARLSFDFRLDGFLAQQGDDRADIILERSQLDRAETHRAARREAGADTEIDASGRELIERGEGVGRGRRWRGRRGFAVLLFEGAIVVDVFEFWAETTSPVAATAITTAIISIRYLVVLFLTVVLLFCLP